MKRRGSDSRSRRRYLRAIAGLGGVSLAGCLNREGPADPTDVDAGEVDAESEGENVTESEDGNATGNDTEEVEGDVDDSDDNESDADADGPNAESDPIHSGYETREVVVETPEGDALGSVTAAIADTRDLRYTGLSDTESLPEDRGMLFVHESVRDLTYVMRRMDFGIDIVFADADGVITEIHHAPEPDPGEDGEDQGYSGRGKYVLEVNYRWTAERDVSAGDVLVFDPIE